MSEFSRGRRDFLKFSAAAVAGSAIELGLAGATEAASLEEDDRVRERRVEELEAKAELELSEVRELVYKSFREYSIVVLEDNETKKQKAKILSKGWSNGTEVSEEEIKSLEEMGNKVVIFHTHPVSQSRTYNSKLKSSKMGQFAQTPPGREGEVPPLTLSYLDIYSSLVIHGKGNRLREGLMEPNRLQLYNLDENSYRVKRYSQAARDLYVELKALERSEELEIVVNNYISGMLSHDHLPIQIALGIFEMAITDKSFKKAVGLFSQEVQEMLVYIKQVDTQASNLAQVKSIKDRDVLYKKHMQFLKESIGLETKDLSWDDFVKNGIR